MIKVFLVEDEAIIRRGIRDNIDWNANGFEFAGEAGVRLSADIEDRAGYTPDRCKDAVYGRAGAKPAG